MHHGNVTCDMRMRILLARATMRRPARVTNANRSVDGLRSERLLEPIELSRSAHDLNPVRGVHGNTRRIVTTILEAPQAFEENGRYFRTTDVTNDSAHGTSLYTFIRLFQALCPMGAASSLQQLGPPRNSPDVYAQSLGGQPHASYTMPSWYGI
jgi:hypothetical protein